MKYSIKLGGLLFAFMLLAAGVQAQKYGYLNSAAIMAEMPEVKQMQSNLQALQTQLQKKGQQMVQEYQQKEQDAITRKERGELSPKQEEEMLAELQKMQQDIMNFQQEMQRTLAEKEQELMQPIYEKIQKAIEEVAKEHGYTMIFDAAALLYAEESADVSALVKAKLGM